MDYINPCNKNQTAKVLERFFYVSNGREYISVIPEEAERITKLPTPDEVKKDTSRVVTYAKEIILNADKYKNEDIEENVLRQYVCNIDPLLDRIIAINIADILNQNKKFQNKEQLKNVWIKSLEELKKDFLQGYEEDDNLLLPQNTVDSIDISKLEIGMTVKNYKLLCELLGQEVKSGKSKKYQLEEFARYFEWEKSGQKFIISDIYDAPLTKEDKRKLGNNSIYVQCIEVILLQYLSKQEGYTRTFTKRNWWEMLGMASHKYGRTPENKLKNLDYRITSWEVRHFYQRCNKKLEQILFSALNSLKNRKLITYEIQTVIVTKDKRGKEQYFEATDLQKKQILEVERHVLHNIMGYEKMFQVFIRFQQADFYQQVNDLLYQQYGWNHYFKQIKVIYTFDGVKEALPELEMKLQKELLNKKVVDYLNSNAKDLYEKNKAEYQQQMKNLIDEYWGDNPRIETHSYKGGKIPVKGYYSYVAPDMYAFCEYLFMGNVNPQGLVPENHVYNKYYGEQGDVEEVLCLRSPHLSRYECPRRKLIVSDKCKKWFKYMESDTVVSCHDMISLFLMCDWDGDHILVVADKAVLKATEGLS